MPVGFNSPARNLFLLGSTGAQLVTNFFKTIDRTAGTDGVYQPDEIRYNVPDQKYILAGTASDSQSKDFGWFEKRTEAGAADWQVKIQSTLATADTSLRAFEIDKSNNLIVAGKTGTVPWVAKYTNGGSISWQVTTNTPNLEYTGIAIDSSNNIYTCGNTPTQSATSAAYIEKYNTSGTPGWSRVATFTGRDVILTKCAVNNKGEVIAVGIIEDDSAYKGYIVKVNANTGEILWDRTIRTYAPDITFGYKPTFCEDVYVDGNNQIYVVGRLFGISETRSFLIKYSPEGNIIWQKETPPGETINHYFVRSDTDTEQTIVYSQYFGLGGMLSKYSKNGDLVFRRLIYSSFNGTNAFGPNGLDADASNYYLLFVDDPVDLLAGDPKRYTFGKVSSSGNGLGNFTYSEGTGQTIYYQSSTIQDKIGRLSDGSVRQDSSDLLTYPFSANKLLFDDLATQVANKKVQIDEPNVFDYGLNTTPPLAYPRISKDAIVYDNNLLLNYDFKNKYVYNTNENLLSYSDLTSGAGLGDGWANGNTTVSRGSNAIAPDGSTTAWTTIYNGTSGDGNIYKASGETPTINSTTYTLSVWAKIKSTNKHITGLRIRTYNNNHAVNFDLKNGIVLGTAEGSPTGSSITAYENGWYRCAMTFVSGTDGNQGVQFYLTTTTGNTFLNDSVANGDEIYMWGAQLAQGSSAGAYISTDANISSPTIVKNLSSTSYTGTINGATFNSAGYFVFNGTNTSISNDIKPSGARSYFVWIRYNSLTHPTGYQLTGLQEINAYTYIGIENGGNFYYFAGTAGGAVTNQLVVNTWYQQGFVLFSNGTRKLYLNGSEIANITSGGVGVTPTSTFYVGNVNNNHWINGNIGELQLYNRALTAQEVSQNFNATRAKYGV